MADIFRIDRPTNKMTLGTTGTTINIASHTASRLLGLDASKNLASITDITVVGKLTAGSFASPLDVTNTRQYGFEIHYSGNDYDVTGIRSRAQLVTTDTSASAQGALLQAANNDNINVGVLNGALIEAIGKATTNAATITMMRGCLVNTEWSTKDTVTDLRILHVRTHTRDAATEGYVSGTGYGLYIENEAVGGNGQALDAGIYFKGTNLSAGNKAFTYGLDFSGATYDTADINLSNGETISNLVNGQIDLKGAATIGDGGTTNYTEIKADGTIEFHGTATVWDDLVLPLDSAKVPAANAPDWESFVGNLNKFAYKVGDYQEFTTELLHGYKEGSSFTFHIHGALNATTAQEEKVQFEIEYSIADANTTTGIGDVFPDGSGSLLTHELVIPDGTPDLSNIYLTIGVDSAATFAIGATIVGRIRRIAKSVGGDELTGNIFVTQVGIHYEIDTVGSRTELTK